MSKKMKKGKKKKQSKIVIDDVDTTTLSRSKLEEFCQQVSDELRDENQHSEYLRMDRDKLVSMIALSREQLNMLRCKNRDIENEIRDAEDKHRINMARKRQEVIHLKNELESKCLNQKIDSSKNIGREIKSHEDEITELIFDINELKRQKNQVENYFHAKKITFEKQRAENIYSIREKDKNIHMLAEARREKVMKDITTQHQIIFSAGYKSLLRLKEKHYQMFLDMNTRKTNHLKHYYNNIVKQNQDLIQFLKNKTQNAKESLNKLDTQYFQIKEENLKLTEELKRLDQEKSIFQKEMSFSKQHKKKLKKTKECLQRKKKMLLNLEIENFVQSMIDEKREVIQREENRETLITVFNSVSKIQIIILVIELFVLHIFNQTGEINSCLSEIKNMYEKKGKRNPVLDLVPEFHDTLDSTNYEIAEIADKRNDLIRTYREILKKFNIPFENTGFKPLRFEEMLTQVDNTRLLVDRDKLFIHTTVWRAFASLVGNTGWF